MYRDKWTEKSNNTYDKYLNLNLMNTHFTQMGITRRWRYQLSGNRRVVCSWNCPNWQNLSAWMVVCSRQIFDMCSITAWRSASQLDLPHETKTKTDKNRKTKKTRKLYANIIARSVVNFWRMRYVSQRINIGLCMRSDYIIFHPDVVKQTSNFNNFVVSPWATVIMYFEMLSCLHACQRNMVENAGN